ncbi:MAG: glycosyl hydrolase [Paludibacter sp.]|nr:glycosyl hydrolase [Paludibacter sp.]
MRTHYIKEKILSIVLFTVLCNAFVVMAQDDFSWPAVSPEMKPGTRWWWMGSAVDTANLRYNLDEYARTGLGTVEITPIYGVQHNDANEIPFLSGKWMKMLSFTESVNNHLGIQTDMNTGTGWPFGGPQVTEEDAASKMLVREYKKQGGSLFSETIVPVEKDQQKVARLQRLMAYNGTKVVNLTSQVNASEKINWKVPKGNWTIIAVFNGKTFQKVKRAAPGGEGYVMDHFSSKAVKNYLSRFEKAFDISGTAYPHNFFNDSYEVYGADWTEDFFEQFETRRGYKLENYLPLFLSKTRTDETRRIVADYRETISDLLLENFTRQWTDWAHSHGSKTRNQAHGSPGNLIDLYATVDVPEIEGFGLSDFGIRGLRKDSLTRKNDSELSMLKYASSAAHIAGKQYVSSETFTWLTEHFRTSLSQCKPDLDLMFVAGVNHMNFHGTAYSPREAAWPGWKFYASIDMSPTNTIWQDAPALMEYITRCQSFLQSGNPDNDFLVYLPVYDVWNNQEGRFFQFTIHQMEKLMPEFIHVVHSIYSNGYDVDYISDKFILSARCEQGQIVTESGARYMALILPSVDKMPEPVLKHLVDLVVQGAKIAVIGNYPNDVPGFAKLKCRRKVFDKSLKKIVLTTDFSTTQINKFQKGFVITGTDYRKTLDAIGVQPEEIITKYGLHAIRRSDETGYHYFVSALKPDDTDAWISLSVPVKSVEIFDPMTGETGKALTRIQNGKMQVYLQLKSGASLILKTFTDKDIQLTHWKYTGAKVQNMPLVRPWTLSFVQSEPQIADTFRLDTLTSWTNLENEKLKVNGGTGVYETTFDLDRVDESRMYLLNLGDVRESARVSVNGQNAGVVWAAPFECNIGKYLKPGENKLRIEVTNLPANRIADYDRRGVDWRIFKEINFVDRNYKKTGYGHWKLMESGLCSPVTIEVYKIKH